LGSGSKIIIACRSNFFKEKDDINNVFSLIDSNKIIFYIAPFIYHKRNIKELIPSWLYKKHLIYQDIVYEKEILEKIDIFQLQNLMSTGLMFSLVMNQINFINYKNKKILTREDIISFI
jgi:hypothetical protein